MLQIGKATVVDYDLSGGLRRRAGYEFPVFQILVNLSGCETAIHGGSCVVGNSGPLLGGLESVLHLGE